MADEGVICALVGSEAVPPAMEVIWDGVLDAAEALEAALAGPADDDAVVRCRRELRAAVLALCAEPVTSGDEVRRKVAALHLLSDLDDPCAPLAVAMATLAVRADLARLGLIVGQLMATAPCTDGCLRGRPLRDPHHLGRDRRWRPRPAHAGRGRSKARTRVPGGGADGWPRTEEDGDGRARDEAGRHDGEA